MSQLEVHPPGENSPRSAVIAVGLLLLGLLALGCQDVVIKNLSARYSVFQLLLIRGVFALAVFQAALLVLRWGNPLATGKRGLHVLRGGMLFGALACYYLALSAMPLLDTVAIFFTAPLLATLMSAVFLKEAVGWGRVGAVFVGFIGVLCMVRPGGGGLVQSAALIAVGAALLYASSIIATRRLGASERAVTTAYYTMLMYIVLAGFGSFVVDWMAAGGVVSERIALTRAWVEPDLWELGQLAIAGLLVCIGFVCLAEAYRRTAVSVLAVWEYSSLVWAGLLGYLAWNEIPGVGTIAGSALIVGSGIYNVMSRR